MFKTKYFPVFYRDEKNRKKKCSCFFMPLPCLDGAQSVDGFGKGLVCIASPGSWSGNSNTRGNNARYIVPRVMDYWSSHRLVSLTDTVCGVVGRSRQDAERWIYAPVLCGRSTSLFPLLTYHQCLNVRDQTASVTNLAWAKSRLSGPESRLTLAPIVAHRRSICFFFHRLVPGRHSWLLGCMYSIV